MAIYPFFPRAMGIYTLNRDFTEKEIQFINNQKIQTNVGNKTSKNKKILERKELNNINAFIVKSVTDYVYSVYQPSTNVEPYITQSWISYTGKGQYHHRHHHRNSFISGVFYVNAVKGVDHILFIKNEYSMFFIEPKQQNDYNSEVYPIMVENGLLVLFPSYTDHMVPTVNHDETRISIAFNIFLRGHIGNEENLCLVELE